MNVTHVLIWDGETIYVRSIEQLMSETRQAYCDGKPKRGSPMAWGTEKEMLDTMENCINTIVKRLQA